MERRDALKSLAALAGATGLAVTPVTVKDAEKVTLVILKPKGLLNTDVLARLQLTWTHAVQGTDLEGVKVVVLDDSIDAEFVRGNG